MSDASDPTNATGQTQPGWYPDPTSGQLRWWDGQAWGQFQESPAAVPMAAGTPGTVANPQQTAMWAHYTGAAALAFTCGAGWLGPLIIYLTSGQQDAFVKDQAAEALNFQITIAIAMFISSILILVIIGFVLLPIVWLVGVIFGVIGGMAASKGEWYRYPFSIKFVKTA